MNNYKSQGQTFEEARANLEEGIFVEDPFFKQHLENIRKQRELGLEFDIDKVEDIMTDLDGNPTGFRVGSLGLDYSDIPGPIRNRTFILDMEQLRAAHGAKTEVQADKLMDMITMLPPHTTEDGEFVSFEILKGRSPTGRFDYPFLPDLHQMPRPELHTPGDDSALKARKHPMIFKSTDLAEDKEEFTRLKATLERNQEVEATLGWPAPPMFIEAIPDVNIAPSVMEEVMKDLTALARQYKVEIYFGTKPALKTALYSLMYGAQKKDLDMSQIDEISVEKAIDMYERNLRKVAIVGTRGRAMLENKLSDNPRGLFQLIGFETFAGISKSLSNFELFSAQSLKVDRGPRDWAQARLRRGKGHNKLKRKGKK